MGRSFFACWYVCLRGVYDHLCSVRALAAVCVRLDVSCRLFQELLRTSCRAVPLPLRRKRKTHTNKHKHAHTSSEQPPPPPQIPPPPPPSLSQLQLLIFSVQAAACLSMCVRVCDGDRQSVCVCVRASMCVSAYWENRCEVQSPRLPFKFSFPPSTAVSSRSWEGSGLTAAPARSVCRPQMKEGLLQREGSQPEFILGLCLGAEECNMMSFWRRMQKADLSRRF